MTIRLLALVLVSRLAAAASAPPSPAVALDKFAVTLYREARPKEGNALISPLSVHAALAMALAGARRRTAETLRQVLELPVGKDPLAGYGAWLSGLVPPAGAPYELRLANAIWGEKSIAFLAPFTDRLRNEFHAPLEPTDFAGAPEQARDAINKWAEEKTAGKIRDLVPKGLVRKDTRAVLANAVYLKAFWEQPFRKEATSPATFYADGKRAIQTPTMHDGFATPYLETQVLQMIELPYKEGQLAMVVLLPKSREGLAALENRLTYDELKSWLGKMDTQTVSISLPTFRFSSEFLLSKPLSAMGLKAAFRDGADFRGMTTAVPIQLSEVVHKTFIDVNETGTEAAAATAVSAIAGGAPHEPKRFVADHPFLFVVYDRRDGGIVFLGRVTSP